VLAGRFGWGEAVRLARMLAADPSSHVAAAVHGWQHPWTREAMLLADVFDLTQVVNWAEKHRQPQLYPRPWDPPPERLGNAGQLTQAEIRAALRARGFGAEPTT
jgi:hypothetical protein